MKTKQAVSFRWTVFYGVVAMAAGVVPAAAQRVITTVAGRDWFLSADGKQAINVPLSTEIRQMAVDRQGNLFIADNLNNVVFKIGRDNITHIAAGNGIQGFSGDGGPATSASLSDPSAVAVDAAGNLYLTDNFNTQIRKVTVGGTISTFAGTGVYGSTGDNGPALRATFQFITAMAFDPAGNLFVCDQSAGRIRRIDLAGTVTNYAGNGKVDYTGDGGAAVLASFDTPVGIVFDKLGQLYIADFNNDVIRRVSTNGIISTFAGNGTHASSGDGGQATAASLASPGGVTVDNSGNLYIADSTNQRIRMVAPSGIITTVAGSGKRGYTGDGGSPLQASFYFPWGMAFDAAGNLLVADLSNSRIRAITLGSTIQTVAGNGLFRFSPANTPANQVFLYRPSGLAADKVGNLYISDTLNNVVRKMGRDGLVKTVAGAGVSQIGPDGVLATDSGLTYPRGLTLAPNGDLVIADRANNQVHRVGADGIVHLITGSPGSGYGFAGDNGPAAQGLLNYPSAVAYDLAGNLYIADEGNDRIRKVSTDGKITTFAGNGLSQSSGDGLLATSASLDTPTGVAVDAAGNVYIAEFYGYRIRKVTFSGTISTFAGTGKYGSSGDGGPATSANLGNVYALAFDPQGNLYFSEAFNGTVRRIAPDGTITTIAGNGKLGFTGDGGPATSAALNVPNGIAIGSDGTIYVADVNNDRIRAILNVNPTFGVSVSQLSFNATSGGSPTPRQSISLSGSLQGAALNGLPFTVTTSTTSGAGWLQVTPDSGAMPTVVGVSVDPASLGPGTYQGTVQINAPGAVPPQVSVKVTATIASATPPKISVDSTQLAFSVLTGADSLSRVIPVSNAGGGVLNVKATTAGGAFLTVSPASGSATPNAPVSFTVTVTPGGLAPGTYSGAVQFASDVETVSVPVTLSITRPQTVLLLSQTGLTFTAVAQGGAPLPQDFGILNIGQGSMDWVASSSTLSGGSAWLSLSQTKGTVQKPYVDISSLDAIVNPAGLASGTYYGQITVTSASDNSPQTISVVLNVLPAGSNPGPQLRPSGLIFVGPAGSSPGSQTVMVSNATANPVTFGSSRTTIPSGGTWVTQVPTDATVAPGQPVKVTVQSDLTSLPVGAQRAVVNLAFTDGSIRSVGILTVVAPPGSTPNAKDGQPHASGCTPTALLVQPTSLTDQFNIPLLQPSNVQVRVVDTCGVPMTTGNVAAGFSNGDPQLNLIHIGDGSWSRTWQPKAGSTAEVQITVVGLLIQGSLKLGGKATISGTVRAGATAPVPFAVGNAASGAGTFIAPGGLVSIYGIQLADTAGGGGGPPFPTQVNGTQVLIGGKALPLRYVADGQVNAQVPFELTANTPQQLLVQRGTTLSIPQDVVVAEAQPAVYTQDQSGKGPGVIANGITNALITSSAPAKVEDVVVIYCNGLGAVTPALPSGTPAPLGGPLSRTVNPMSVTIGGVPATVNFAGLAPGYPDLYQVNAVVPPGVTPGDAPVVLTIAGQSSPPVTMAVR